MVVVINVVVVTVVEITRMWTASILIVPVVISHDSHGTKMTGTNIVTNSMISRSTNSTN